MHFQAKPQTRFTAPVCLVFAMTLGAVALGIAHGADSRRLVQVGERLFFDKRLSADGTVSCASCHKPELAFSDGLSVSVGIGGKKGTRNAPSLLQTAGQTSFFWDGRQPTLERQVLEPFFNEREHGLRDTASLISIVAGDPALVSEFKAIYPQGVSQEAISSALAAYVRSLAPAPSRFDRYWKGREQAALNGAERQGLDLFRGAAQCATCHSIREGDAPLTDNKFHSLSVGLVGLAPTLAKAATKAMNLDAEQRYRLITSDAQIGALGRFNVTRNPADIGKYRTPSLHNVAVTAPYMHDGSVATLEEAVELELYYRSTQQGRLVILTPREKADLLAFLKTLTSEPREKKQGTQ